MMKRTLLLVFLLFSLVPLSARSMQDTTIYYNKDWKPCAADTAAYYRIIEDYQLKKEAYTVTAYYITGEKQMEGNYLDPTAQLEYGEFRWYYRNGQLHKEGRFSKGQATGDYKAWYADGSPQLEGRYSKRKPEGQFTPSFKVIAFWDSTGEQLVHKGRGTYYELNDENEISARGAVRRGLKHGPWTGTIASAGLSYQEEYKRGKLLKGVSTDSSGNTYHYEQLEVVPRPYPDFQAYYTYLRGTLSYPAEAIANNIKGRVYVEFFVDKDGSLKDVKILRGLGYGCDEEALRVLKEGPGWLAGESRGRKVKVRMVLPLLFHIP